jgi:hypothetical protein
VARAPRDGVDSLMTEDPGRRGGTDQVRAPRNRDPRKAEGGPLVVLPGLPCAPADVERERRTGHRARYRLVDAQDAPFGAASMVMGTAHHNVPNGGYLRCPGKGELHSVRRSVIRRDIPVCASVDCLWHQAVPRVRNVQLRTLPATGAKASLPGRRQLSHRVMGCLMPPWPR